MFVATSDIHGNLKNLVPFKQTLELAFAKCKELGCPLFIGGDLNDTKATLRSEFVGFICEIFYRYKDVEKYILIGNHDMENHHNHESHSLEFMKSLPNTQVIDNPGFIMGDWYAIPYRHTNEDVLKELQIAKDLGAKKLLMHQGVMGAKQSEYILDKSSVTLEDLEGFDLVLTGHYHSHQTMRNVTYFGSPFTVSFAEANQPKCLWFVSDDGHMEAITTDCRKHIELVWESKIPEQIPEIDPNDIVKVILRGSKTFCLNTSKDKIKKLLKLESVSVVPEITTKAAKRISADKIHKPLEVIDDYLKRAKTDLSKKELRTYLQGINNENTAS